MDGLKSDFTEELVIARSPFEAGVSDNLEFLLQKSIAAIVADLMTMGEGDQEFSAEKHIEGVGEILNQLCGILSTHLTDLGEIPVTLGKVETGFGTVQEYTEKWESHFRIDLFIDIEGFDQGIIALLLAPQTYVDLQNLSQQEGAPAEDRPPPAVLDEEMGDQLPDSRHPTEVRNADFEDFGAESGGRAASQSIDALMDIDLPVIIELGRTNMFIRDILELSTGSIVELNKLSGEPVDLYINDKRFARGEVVVIDENFGIRITDLVKVEDRIRSLR